MRCRFCAEEIQDEAIVCRFCGAEKQGSAWIRSDTPRRSPRVSFFFRSSGVLFILSAVFEAYSFTNPVPLLGAMRDGLVAGVYHALFVVVFLSIGVGLFKATHWGYRAVLFGSLVYSVDRVLYLLDDTAQQAVVSEELSKHPELLRMIDADALAEPMKLVALGTLLGFWLFVFLVHRRRADFGVMPGS